MLVKQCHNDKTQEDEILIDPRRLRYFVQSKLILRRAIYTLFLVDYSKFGLLSSLNFC